ncbi:hypothetical protein GYMLUDRAFT_590187 [Collybiopsis luxurians FD-317 M1]|uniref:BTB domain-containing protein n=1 Tax=Collybiopsis luxurians FD-317 M1 TaxID=944289 RepID=A0A0D0CF00_9AGAR|nr:hypothetical protein GYMLUDRAFT_590187 [Collybiopsis luxurians FD-317 M1]
MFGMEVGVKSSMAFGPGTASRLFQASDADVVIRSSDNVNFYLHKRNLEYSTDGFPPTSILPTSSSENEVVTLTESSATLEVVFQFVYPQRYPELDYLDLKSLLTVAEAAEKYGVFAAIYGCQFALRKYANSDPKEVLAFAAKYNYYSVIERIPQRFRIDTPLSELTDILSPHVYRLWSLDRERWLSELQNVTRTVPIHQCSWKQDWIIITRTILGQMISPSRLLEPQIDAIFGQFTAPEWNECCVKCVEMWKKSIKSDWLGVEFLFKYGNVLICDSAY